MNPPVTEQKGTAESYLPSLHFSAKDRWRLLSTCAMCFANGMGDASPGALIPHIEDFYHIGYAIVALIFVASALGFIISAPITSSLDSGLGRARLYAISQILITGAYVLLSFAPPFPAVVFAYLPVGFGVSINLALNNVFCAHLANGTVALGLLHGSYGLGATIGPLAATAMASHGVRWSYFYFISLGVSIFNLCFATWAFWNYEKDMKRDLRTDDESPQSSVDNHSNEPTAVTPDTNAPLPTEYPPQKKVSNFSLLKCALRNRATLLGALFIFAYQGAEVSISGWIVSFMIVDRGGSPAQVGYVSAGFWAGVMVGRFVLSHPLHRFLGEKGAVFAVILGAAGLQLIVWLVRDIVGDAIATAIIGLLLGPVYPCAVVVFSKLLPDNRHVQISSLGIIAAMGGTGGAAAPFVTGLWAQRAGIAILHPICMFLYGIMEVCWACLPGLGKMVA